MMSKTIMAFDYGTTSIGSAIGQTLTGTATALKAFKARDGIPKWEEIESQIKEWLPHLLVVGLPLNLDGEPLDNITEQANKFARRLNGRFNLKVEMQDERLSTKEARSDLFEQGGYKALKKGRVDNQSAIIILESWFNHQGQI